MFSGNTAEIAAKVTNNLMKGYSCTVYPYNNFAVEFAKLDLAGT